MKRNSALGTGAAAAAVGALLLLLPPTDVITETSSIAWRFAELPAGSGAFDVALVLDTEAPAVSGDLEAVAAVTSDAFPLEGLRVTIEGIVGDGPIAIDVVAPDGSVVVDDERFPGQQFRYPSDRAEPAVPSVTVEYPAQIPEPGGSVVFVMRVQAPADLVTPLVIDGFGVDAFSMDDESRLDSGRPDSCSAVGFPIELLANGELACTYVGRVEGVEGERLESVPFVLTSTGEWSSVESVWIEITAPTATWPVDPPMVSSRPGELVESPAIRSGIARAQAGRYSIRVVAPGGSEGFDLEMRAERTVHHRIMSGLDPGRVLGFALAAIACGVALATWRERAPALAALALLVGSLSVAVTLFHPNHDWFWRPWSHLIWIATLVVAGAAGRAIAAGGRLRRFRSMVRPLRSPVVALAALMLFLTTVTSASYGEGFIGGDAPGTYSGDYMFMGLHVFLFQLTVPLVALAAHLVEGPGEPST